MPSNETSTNTRKNHMVIDFTYISNAAYMISKLYLLPTDETSILINYAYSNPKLHPKFSVDPSENSRVPYNLYGYTLTEFTNRDKVKVNYSADIARMKTNYVGDQSSNRYLDYKYAYHYPLSISCWNKFSRFKINYSAYRDFFETRPISVVTDFYSFLSLFDSINQYGFDSNINLDNTNYKDFKVNNTDSDEYVDDKPVKYHGRNIYMDKNFIYIKINDAMSLTKNHDIINACKYMIVELDGNIKKPVTLNNMFSLCITHAYILNNDGNKLELLPEGLLDGCKATKFGDISDARTLLNLTNVDNMSYMCSNSNVEDLSMHTIVLNNAATTVNIQHAFYKSKIKKLPKGLADSLGRGFKKLIASYLFREAKYVETDISKLNIPTLRTVPSEYYLENMYEKSNCRHINRGIISTNDADKISAANMYKGTTITEDTPLPDGMFKNYTYTTGMFKNTTFETADTFKYIYSEFAKGADVEGADTKNNMTFGDITIKNDIEGANINVPQTKEDYTKTHLVPFVISENLSNQMINISIAGRRTYKNRDMALTVIGPACRELSFGSSLEDLKRASVRGAGELLSYYIDAGIDFKNFYKSYYVGDSTVTEFFFVNPRPMDITIFRKLALLMHGNDYFNMYNYLFEGAFMDRGNILGLSDDHTLTSILFSGTREDVDMLSLDEIKKPGFLTPIMTRKFDNACAIVNTNGKNLKWTLSRWHYSKLTADNGFRTSYGVHKFYNFISVFTDAVYLLRAIKTQTYFTKIFNNGKIEFIFRARNYTELKKFLAVMSVYLGPDDYDKPVGRYLLIYENNLYDSKTDSRAISGLASSMEITEYVNKINNGTIDNYSYAASYTPGER